MIVGEVLHVHCFAKHPLKWVYRKEIHFEEGEIWSVRGKQIIQESL